VCNRSWVWQAREPAKAGSTLPAFGAWPVDAPAVLVRRGSALTGFEVALAWMAAQQQPSKQRHHWPRLLEALHWSAATAADLRALQQHPRAARMAGLQRQVTAASLQLLAAAEAKLAAGKT
jgi:hypothetical protein